MHAKVPELPSPDEWRRFGVAGVVEIHGGKQSRVFSATLGGQDVMLKLTDRMLTDRDALHERMAAVAAIDTASVISPIEINDELIQPIGDWLMTATPFVAGGQPDVGASNDARLMGESLAQLHFVLEPLPAYKIPAVAPLRSNDPDEDQSGWQLLHGDFSNKNLITTPEGLRVFDFDDCGYGPVEYDIANSLYMVLFDAETSSRAMEYNKFRSNFLDGYAGGSTRQFDENIVGSLIELRIAVLGRWLDDLTAAPIGIRTSSPEWLATLRSFVQSHDHQ